MAVYVMLNDRVFTIDFSRFYTPLLLIDVKSHNIVCDMNNKFLFFIENPRANIQLISGFFDFYFKSEPEDYMLGQVVSKVLISYRTLDSVWEVNENIRNVVDFMPCVLFTKGLVLQEMLIYMPFQKPTYIKELKYYFVPKVSGQCVICLDDKETLINLHQDDFMHCVCSECILKLETDCPVCRQKIDTGI